MMLQKHLYLLFFFIRQVEMLNLAMGMLVLILFDTFRTWVAQEQVQVGLDTRLLQFLLLLLLLLLTARNFIVVFLIAVTGANQCW